MTNLKCLLVAGGLAVIAVLAAPGPASAAPPNYIHGVFVLQQPGQTKAIPFPAPGPIYVMVSAMPHLPPPSPQGAAIPQPIELMTAVVDRDPFSHQLTWISTSSNAAQSNGATVPGNLIQQIANIDGGNYTLTAIAPGANAPNVGPNDSLLITYAASPTPSNPLPVTFTVTLIW